jgi:alpha-tubulin suppressor-like RCC1 family protein
MSKNKGGIAIALVVLLILIIFLTYSLYMREKVLNDYTTAINVAESGDYETAYAIFDKLGNYKDSIERADNAYKAYRYAEAVLLFEEGEYEEAAEIFIELGEYAEDRSPINYEPDISEKEVSSVVLAKDAKYMHASQLYNEKSYEKSALLFIELGAYKDSELLASNALLYFMPNVQERAFEEAVQLMEAEKYDNALKTFEALEISDYANASEKAAECRNAIKRRELANYLAAGIHHSTAVRADGTVAFTGNDKNNSKVDINKWTEIASIDTYGEITIGLKTDGTVVAAGNSNFSLGTLNWKDILAVSAGERFAVGLTANGTVVSVGHDAGDGQRRVDNWGDIIAVATGWRHTVGLKSDSSILITGYRATQQLNEIDKKREEWENVIAIDAGGGGDNGEGHTVGLRSDGTVVAVGDNYFNQCDVKDWSDIVAVSAGDWHTVGLKSDGTVVTTYPSKAEDRSFEGDILSVSEWSDVVAVSAGYGYTLGLKADGSVISVGYNDKGQQPAIGEWTDIKRKESWKR